MILNRNRKKWISSLFAMTALTFTACQSSGAGGNENQNALQLNPASESSAELPWGDEMAVNDPSHITVALQYVSYVDDGGKDVLGTEQARKVVAGINNLYKPCNLHFRVEEYVPVNPKDRGLELNPDAMSDLAPIRSEFETDSMLTVVNTGNWDNSGGLGADGANAWTMMPGNTPTGAIIEGSAADSANLVAHELGHYLNLDHASVKTNLMNPVIYDNSTVLSAEQCETVRASAERDWPGSVRR